MSGPSIEHPWEPVRKCLREIQEHDPSEVDTREAVVVLDKIIEGGSQDRIAIESGMCRMQLDLMKCLRTALKQPGKPASRFFFAKRYDR